MYGYGRDQVLSTTYDIIQRVPQLELYKYIVGYEPRESRYYTSPVRQHDVTPGTWYIWEDGKLFHIDFADPIRQRRDCFQILMERSNLTLPQAVSHLISVFKLTPESPILFPELAQGKGFRRGSQEGKTSGLREQSTEITFKARVFDDDDKKFWYDRYGVQKRQLIDDQVFPIIWYRFWSKTKNDWIVIRPRGVAYAYTDFEHGRIKIYCPEADKKHRFLTNCGANDIGSIHKATPLPQLVIAKSYKDCRVLRNEGVNAVWFQNEGMVPDMELLQKLVSPYREIILLFDNDYTGMMASQKLTDIIRPMTTIVRATHIPKSYQNTKDPADLRHYQGPDELKRFLDLNQIHH